MSDLVLKMFGSIAGAESKILHLDERFQVKTIVTEAPHGTAPSLQGKNIANPVAMIFAIAALIQHIPHPQAQNFSQTIYESVLGNISEGIKTPDLQGNTTTSGFVDAVLGTMTQKLSS